jgi:mannose-6-phosphate isomerase
MTTPATMLPLRGRIRSYAWGSHTDLARLTGRPAPTAEPEAELWLGAHPDDPSDAGGDRLDGVVAADPVAWLGSAAAARFGRLPYLMKILAAQAPLSLQAHPTEAHAAAAYAAGRPGYTDPYHKPELLVAITDFDALCGFAPPSAAADVLETIGHPAVAPIVDVLRGPTDDAGRLRAAMHLLMSLRPEGRHALVDAVVASGHPLAVDLARHYPGDIGVVVALLLNRVRLRPDQAIYMPAGHLHAYLSGTGVELMAASDNVLRGGLTPKPIDVPELLSVLSYDTVTDPVLLPVQTSDPVITWATEASEFELFKATITAGDGPVELPANGPRIAVCTAGTVRASSGGRGIDLGSGSAVVLPAAADALVLSGAGTVFQADVGIRSRP